MREKTEIFESRNPFISFERGIMGFGKTDADTFSMSIHHEDRSGWNKNRQLWITFVKYSYAAKYDWNSHGKSKFPVLILSFFLNRENGHVHIFIEVLSKPLITHLKFPRKGANQSNPSAQNDHLKLITAH